MTATLSPAEAAEYGIEPDAIAAPEPEPAPLALAPRRTYKRKEPVIKRPVFVDLRYEESVRGWICGHGTERIRSAFPDIIPEWFVGPTATIYRAARVIEGKGGIVRNLSLTDHLAHTGQLDAARGASNLQGTDDWSVAEYSLHNLRDLYHRRESARVGKELMAGAITQQEAVKALTAIVESTTIKPREDRMREMLGSSAKSVFSTVKSEDAEG